MITDEVFPAPENSPIDSRALKVIALLLMLVDHAGHVLFPQYRFLRYIGRLAFPLFIFMLTEGFFHSHDRRKYFARLCAFAVISELAFDFGLRGMWIYPEKNNVFLTLVIGFVVMALLDFMFHADKSAFRFPTLIYGSLLGVMGCIILADLLRTDYGSYGVVAIGVCFVLRHFRAHRALALAAAVGVLCVHNSIEAWAFFALPLAWLYNGKPGPKNLAFQYACYAFYPVHLILLRLIYLGLNR